MSFPKLLVLGFREDSRFMDYDHPQKGARITSHQPSIAHQLPINHPSIKHQSHIIFQIYQFHSLFFTGPNTIKKKKTVEELGGTSPRSSNSKGIHSGWFTSSFITGPAPVSRWLREVENLGDMDENWRFRKENLGELENLGEMEKNGSYRPTYSIVYRIAPHTRGKSGYM